MNRFPLSTRPGAPRVLHVITPSKMAGAETALARILRRTTGELAVPHCISSRTPAVREMRAAGMDVEMLGIGGKANLLALPRLQNAAKRFQADLLHSHLSSASWWCGWLEQLGGPPSVGHVHGFTSALWHRSQSHLIACSEAVKQDLVAKGISADRITALSYPIDANDVQPQRSPSEVRAEFGVDLSTPVVGTFAHLSIKKGYRELFEAACLLLAHMPQAQFWCFGEGLLRAELEEKARAAGISDRFRLFGFRRDVPDLMQAIDVMALPSHREPFGLVYVEAALCKRPVIACRAGGAPEIIQHGDTGLLVPPRDPTALAEALGTLLQQRTAAAEMGRRGRELVLSRFGWREFLLRLREVYDRVLDGSEQQQLEVAEVLS